ncbi:unnamed protein product [Cercospora beticola]|nr:unnamed protein product [Cercospora beticola]
MRSHHSPISEPLINICRPRTYIHLLDHSIRLTTSLRGANKMAASQPPTTTTTAVTGGEDHHADSSAADELPPNSHERVVTPDFDGVSTREVVWYNKMEALYYADVFRLREVTASSLKNNEPSEAVQEGWTVYVLFEHPNEAERVGESRTEASILTGPRRDELLALRPPKPTNFKPEMLVLAKGDHQYYYPAEIFKIEARGRQRSNRYHVRFLARRFHHLEHDKEVGYDNLVPLSSASGLRVAGSKDIGYWSYLPTTKKLRDDLDLGDIKPSSRSEGKPAPKKPASKKKKKNVATEDRVVKKKASKGKKAAKKGAKTDV